jgi:hypothetical protein
MGTSVAPVTVGTNVRFEAEYLHPEGRACARYARLYVLAARHILCREKHGQSSTHGSWHACTFVVARIARVCCARPPRAPPT